MRELMDELERMRRSVGDNEDGHVVELRRVYGAPPEAVWDACTNPERIPRWFLPVSGDLRLGGRYQLEGNAGGEIRECDPPRRLALTWEYGAKASHVTLDLAPSGDATELVLRHAVPDDAHWAEYGPGAVGVGWELGLLSLAGHLEGEPVEATPEFMRSSAAAWGEAHGVPGAEEIAAKTAAFYAP